MSTLRFDPLRELLNVEKEFSRIFNNFSGSRVSEGSSDKEAENAVWAPLTDISEDKDNFYLSLDLPGVKREEVKLSFQDGSLIISGERKTEHEAGDKTHHRIEKTYGKYYRSYKMPANIQVEKISAEFKEGVLSVVIPKPEEIKPKSIEISVK